MRARNLPNLLSGPLGAAGTFFLATWCLVSTVRIHPAVHLDTARDLLLARDCVFGHECSGAGPRSSFGGWTQGALWSHVLELRELFGLGLSALEEVAHLALAAAAALLPAMARTLDRRANATTWALWFPTTLITIGYPTLWNPTLWPLALSVLYLAFFRAVRSGGLLAFAWSGAALAFALDLHASSALLIPFMLAVVVGVAARPLLAALLAAATGLAVVVTVSPGASAQNWGLVVQHAPWLALVLVLAAVVGGGARRGLGQREPGARAETIAWALCIYLALVLPALAVGTAHPLHARYLAPLVAPAAILLSTRAPSMWIRGVTVVFAVAGYLAFAIGDYMLNPRFRLPEVEQVAASLYGRGLSFPDLYRHLRGPDAFHLLSTLAALEPLEPPALVASSTSQDLLVIRASRGALPQPVPDGWDVVDLDRSHVAVIVTYTPWIQLDPVEVCREPAGGGRTCTTLAIDPASFATRRGMRWADRAYPSLPGLERPTPGDRVTYRMQVRANTDDTAREVRLLPDHCRGWRVIRASGAVDSHAQVARIDAAIRSGDITFEVVAGTGCRWGLPPFTELREDDAGLARLLSQVFTAR